MNRMVPWERSLCAALPSGYHRCHHGLSDGGSISELINYCLTYYMSLCQDDQAEAIGARTAPRPSKVSVVIFSPMSTAASVDPMPTTEGTPDVTSVSVESTRKVNKPPKNTLDIRLAIDVPVNGPLVCQPHWEYVHPSPRNLNLRLWCLQGRNWGTADSPIE